MILNNNIKAKQIKKQIKVINKKLKELSYNDTELDDKVKTNIDFAKKIWLIQYTSKQY